MRENISATVFMTSVNFLDLGSSLSLKKVKPQLQPSSCKRAAAAFSKKEILKVEIVSPESRLEAGPE